ncbi:hypothetical protein [uncultured Legionella sp.]|uniref:hypothetical protein n=1 Tax=uncultured Legionella sp. TaxID=210934 RepID=UPI0026234C0C|nr:hypothetical protein [uncultured Legionella sp.]
MIYEIYSFDFDGALANLQYLASKDKDIIAANIDLLDQIKSYIHHSASQQPSSSSAFHKKPKVIVFVGSNRQGLIDDFGNSTADGRGSCYPAIIQVSKYLDAKLDDMLLGDIFNNMADGTCFKQAMKLINKKNNKDYVLSTLPNGTFFPDWLHDDTKLTLIYAQIHKMSQEHPNDTLNYNFLDDRDDLLLNLHDYFLKYPEMIPHNVTLNLKKYKGPIDREGNKIDPLVTEYEPIKGTRPYADQDYRQTIKTISAVTIEQMTAQDNDLIAAKATQPIRTYAEAQQYKFNMTSIKCVQYYKPGMLPVNPPELPAQHKGFSFFVKKAFSNSNLSVLSATSHTDSLSSRPSSSTIIPPTPTSSWISGTPPISRPNLRPRFTLEPTSATSSFDSVQDVSSDTLEGDEFDFPLETLTPSIDTEKKEELPKQTTQLSMQWQSAQNPRDTQRMFPIQRTQSTTVVNEQKEKDDEDPVETPNSLGSNLS